LQFKVVSEWLRNCEAVSSTPYKIAGLHVAAQWHKTLLRSLAETIGPLEDLAPHHAVTVKVLGIIDGGEHVSAQLTAQIMSSFYDLMLQQRDTDNSTAQI